MKCEHCGKNEVTFLYQSNVNGKITEHRLCGECAEKLGYTRNLAVGSRRMMESFFNDDFFGGSLLNGFFNGPSRLMGRMPEDPFDDFFQEMPALQAAPGRQETPKPEQREDLVDQEARSRFSRMRELNALRMELKRAVHRQEFEKAAELRDRIKALEEQKG